MPKHGRQETSDSSDSETKRKVTKPQPKKKKKKSKTYKEKKARQARKQAKENQKDLVPNSTQTDTQNFSEITLSLLSDTCHTDSESETEVNSEFKKLTINAEQQTENSTCNTDSQCDPPSEEEIATCSVGLQTDPEPAPVNNSDFKTKIQELHAHDLPDNVKQEFIRRQFVDSVRDLCEQYLETASIDAKKFFTRNRNNSDSENARWDTERVISQLQSTLYKVINKKRPTKPGTPVPLNKRGQADKKLRDQIANEERARLTAQLAVVRAEQAAIASGPVPSTSAATASGSAPRASAATASGPGPSTSAATASQAEERVSAREQRQINAAIQASLNEFNINQPGPSGVPRYPAGPSRDSLNSVRRGHLSTRPPSTRVRTTTTDVTNRSTRSSTGNRQTARRSRGIRGGASSRTTPSNGTGDNNPTQEEMLNDLLRSSDEEIVIDE